jgi:uncharacterized protein (TIGR02118 family)
MIKVSVLYPNAGNTQFDMEYYCKHHIPLVQRLLASALKGASVDAGLSGAKNRALRLLTLQWGTSCLIL